jgi:regulator of protease activity HflC (stomatin/prohibitin superfamily)
LPDRIGLDSLSPEMPLAPRSPGAAPRLGEPLVRRLSYGYGLAALALIACLSFRGRAPLIDEVVRLGVAGAALAGLLLAAAGAIATEAMLRVRIAGGAVGAAARWPQVALVTPLTVLAAVVAWRLCPDLGPAPASSAAIGAAALGLSFLALIAERTVAALPPARTPEAPDLRALALLPVLVTAAAGLGAIAAGVGAPFVGRTVIDCALILAFAVGAELALRAAARAFLPPPTPEAARAAIRSGLARFVAEGVRERSLSAPVRAEFGIELSRSYALAHARRAAAPTLLFLAGLSWGLSGFALVDYDKRAIYERFGAPAGVMHPGLHAILPWPFGRTRLVEFGAVHEEPLGGATLGPIDSVGAEAVPPPSLDRLWEEAHPGEMIFLIASGASGRQSFQAVAADVRVRWRVGLSDEAALDAAYRTEAPEPLVRAAASRAVARALAGRTLDEVLGERRDRFADMLRASAQADLDAVQSGIEIVAMVVEAIHPPAGAAVAYHAVQAAEINAEARVASERGRAAATIAVGAERAIGEIADAEGLSAELKGQAKGDAALFAADRDGAALAPEAFVRERYWDRLVAALARVPMTIVDSRIAPADAPVLDLRPPGAPSAGPPAPD